jgi:hypothetical protein
MPAVPSPGEEYDRCVARLRRPESQAPSPAPAVDPKGKGRAQSQISSAHSRSSSLSSLETSPRSPLHQEGPEASSINRFGSAPSPRPPLDEEGPAASFPRPPLDEEGPAASSPRPPLDEEGPAASSGNPLASAPQEGGAASSSDRRCLHGIPRHATDAHLTETDIMARLLESQVHPSEKIAQGKITAL